MTKQITTGKNFLFAKQSEDTYEVSYNLENNRLLMAQLINMELFKVISELNNNNYEIYDFKIVSSSEAIIFALIKNIFKEITPKQQYYCFRVKLEMTNQSVNFILTPDFELGEKMLSSCKVKAQHLPVKELHNVYTLVSPHKVHFKQNIIFNGGYQLNFISETIIGIVLKMASKKIIKFIKEL